MIALDTNVLIRYIQQDGGGQAAISREVLEERLSDSEPGFVSLPVLCELCWTLRTTYKHSRNAIRETVILLLQASQLAFENAETVAEAVKIEDADIPDAIIHLVGQASGCSGTLTFDKKFARLVGVELLGG